MSVGRSAEIMAIRLLLSDLYVELCLAAADPVAEVERRKLLYIQLLDDSGDELSQLALHELETFWKHVAREVSALRRDGE